MLRITSGEFRNRRIEVPDTGLIRPMLEKPRQALFSILGQDVCEGRSTIDCFAGSGVLGFEALSRGASRAFFFDLDARHVTAIEELAQRLHCAERIATRRGDAMRLLTPKLCPHDLASANAKLVFLDPPHKLMERESERFWAWVDRLATLSACGNDAILVYGSHSRQASPERTDHWTRIDRREYGNVALSIFSRA